MYFCVANLSNEDYYPENKWFSFTSRIDRKVDCRIKSFELGLVFIFFVEESAGSVQIPGQTLPATGGGVGTSTSILPTTSRTAHPSLAEELYEALKAPSSSTVRSTGSMKSSFPYFAPVLCSVIGSSPTPFQATAPVLKYLIRTDGSHDPLSRMLYFNYSSRVEYHPIIVPELHTIKIDVLFHDESLKNRDIITILYFHLRESAS